jgi:CheY-like chemotaxis protein
MDVRMPLMDGYEATRKIRALEGQNPKTVIIALTAGAFDEDQANVLAAGCNDLLHKPFKKQELLDKIETHLGVHYMRATAQTPASTQVLDQPRDRFTDRGFSLQPTMRSLKPTDLSTMPQEWLQKLYESASQANTQRVLELVQDIPEQQIILRNLLMDLINDFRLDIIMDTTQQTLE